MSFNRLFCVMMICSLFLSVKTSQAECKAEGDGSNHLFASDICKAAEDYGINPSRVRIDTPGAVIVTFSEDGEKQVRKNSTVLKARVILLTDWIKENFNEGDAVSLSFEGTAGSFAQGTRSGSNDSEVTLIKAEK